MCGIYGIAKSPTPYTTKQLNIVKKVLREIAIDSETRGSQSSGIARVGSSTRIHKSLLPSSKFVDTLEYNESVKSLKDDSFILLGHTRFATQGAIVKSNAHPFRVGDVVGAHNGCVYNVKEMETQLDKQCPVDSQLIFKAINDNDNIQEAVKDFDSDFALSFVKANPMVLYLCRESNRPLHVAYIPSMKTLFYASESAFIEDALTMNNIEADVFSLNKNTLYTFDVSKFTDEKMNVVKESFKYDSRVYQYQINKYPTQVQTNAWSLTDDEWEPIVPQSMIDNETLHLSQVYGGRPEEWFWDETQQQWYYLDNVSGEIKSEEQISQEQYYDSLKWEEEANATDR
jgi:glucosamine 6-phosphate synthetase-like amidotransferase/phosphosugar isomerase protein